MTTIDRIFELMEQNNLNAKEFANKLEISQGNITDWKKGRSKPSVKALEKIANYFNVSVDFLLGNTDKPSYVDVLTEYLKPLNLNDKEFNIFKELSIAYLKNTNIYSIAEIVKEAPDLDKLFRSLDIVGDIADNFQKTAKLNKIQYIIQQLLNPTKNTDINDFDYLVVNSETNDIIQKELIEAINRLDKSKIVQYNNIIFSKVPILGKIAAGQPILAEEYLEGYLPVDPNIYGVSTAEDLFYLRIARKFNELKS